MQNSRITNTAHAKLKFKHAQNLYYTFQYRNIKYDKRVSITLSRVLLKLLMLLNN
jgi:hypothetical protein